MFQVFHIGGLLQFEYLTANDNDTRWSIKRLSLSAGTSEDQSRWEVELVSDKQRAVVSWHTFLTQFRPAEGTARNVSSFISDQLDAIHSQLSRRANTGGLISSIFSRKKIKYATTETLWSPEDSYRQWILPGIVVEANEHQDESEFISFLLIGVDADRKLVQADADAAEKGQQATVLTLPPQPTSLDKDLQTLSESYRDIFQRNLDQALANSKSLLSLSDRTNSPSNIESVVNSTLHGAVTMALLELGAKMFPEQQIDAQVHVGNAAPAPSLAGEQFTTEWTADVPIWSENLKTSVQITSHISLQPGQRSDKGRVEPLVNVVRTLLSDWLENRSDPIASGGDGWICLLPETPWSEDVFAIWLGMASPKQKIARLVDVLQHPAAGGDPHGKERQAATQRLMASILSERSGLDLYEWQALAPALSSLSADDRQGFTTAFQSTFRNTITSDSCGPMEAENWLSVWKTATDSKNGLEDDLFRALEQRCAENGNEEWSAMLMRVWETEGRDASRIPSIAAALIGAGTPRAEWTAALATTLDKTDCRRQASEALTACVVGSRTKDVRLHCAPLLTLAEEVGKQNSWNLNASTRELVASLMDAWAADLDRSQDVDGWQDLLARRGELAQLGLYAE